MKKPLLPKLLRAFVLLTLVWLAAAVILLSNAGVDPFGFMGVGAGSALLMLALLALLVVRQVRKLPWGRPANWLIFPAALLLVLAVFFSGTHNPLFRLRFLASRQALTQHGAAALAGTSPQAGRIGLFNVRRVQVQDGQVRFLTTTCGVFAQCGVVYSPNSPPTAVYNDHFHPLGGPWYLVHQRI